MTCAKRASASLCTLERVESLCGKYDCQQYLAHLHLLKLHLLPLTHLLELHLLPHLQGHGAPLFSRLL